MLIIGFQLAIFLSLLVSRIFGERCLLSIACLWTIETVALVYFSPLIVLQLVVIWISFWAILEIFETSPTSAMDEANDYDVRIRQAVDVVLSHSKRIQNTRRASEQRGRDTVDKYNELYAQMLLKITKQQQDVVKRAQRSVRRGYFPPLRAVNLEITDELRRSHSVLQNKHEEFLRNTRRTLLSDAELATIFCHVAQQIDLSNLRQILTLPKSP